MKVTALIPAYNSADWIAEALESVAAQTAPPDEVIVMDDGSTDGTAEHGRVARGDCLRPGRVGVSAARNLGVRAASGELIALLDSDDVWTPDKLEIQTAHMRTHPGAALHDHSLPPFPGRRLGGGHPRRRARRNPSRAGFPSTLVARREAFDVVGEFDESMPSGGDIDWFARAVDLGVAMEVLPQVLMLKRAHNDSLTWTMGHRSIFLSLRRSLTRKRAEEAVRVRVSVVIPVHNGSALPRRGDRERTRSDGAAVRAHRRRRRLDGRQRRRSRTRSERLHPAGAGRRRPCA